MRLEPILKELGEVTAKLQILTSDLVVRDEKALKYRDELIMNSTLSEKLIKRKLQLLNIKYEFQKIIYVKDYFRIVDFYLPEYNLIIEVDGFYHLDKKQLYKDRLRTQELVELGYNKLLRLDNIKSNNISEENLLKLIKQVKGTKLNKTSKIHKILKYKQRIDQLQKLVVKLSKT